MIKSNKSLICIQAANCNCCSGYLCVQLQKDDRKWQKSETSTSSVRIFRRQDLQFELPQFLDLQATCTLYLSRMFTKGV